MPRGLCTINDNDFLEAHVSREMTRNNTVGGFWRDSIQKNVLVLGGGALPRTKQNK